MKENQNPIDRLLRSAAAAPDRRAEAAAPSWSLEQRVLAALRNQRATEDLSWLAPLLRRAFTAAGAMVVVVGFLALHAPSESIASHVPTHELAVMDQELALALVPSSTAP